MADVISPGFDPYHKWLGIPKNQRSPTLYQLLGIMPGESDLEVIEEATVRQTTPGRSDCSTAKKCSVIRATLARSTPSPSAKTTDLRFSADWTIPSGFGRSGQTE